MNIKDAKEIRKTQVQAGISQLEGVTSRLVEKAEQLSDRLSPVLPSGPMAREDESKPIDPELVPLAAELDSIYRQLKGADVVLGRLLEYLEL